MIFVKGNNAVAGHNIDRQLCIIDERDTGLQVGKEYIAFGRVSEFNGRFNIPHPEIEEANPDSTQKARHFDPVYPTTAKLTQKGLDARGLHRLLRTLLDALRASDLPETLPDYLLAQYKLIGRWDSLQRIHFPETQLELDAATRRLKFEELFYLQLRLLKMKLVRIEKFKGQVFGDTAILTDFYTHHLPFPLTEAQKKVIREIYQDMRSGHQMNRLLQGDVGSGKTIVGCICMLLAIGSDAQAALIADRNSGPAAFS